MLALVARNSGIRASSLLKIRGEIAALDFDAACAYRLLRFENERESDRFKFLNLMLGGKPEDDGDIHDDEHTQHW